MSDLPVLSGEYQTDNDTPLPLIVAKRWNFPLAYVETEEGFFYSIQDWMRGLIGTDSNQTAKNWSRFKKHIINYRVFPYVASDGKTYKRDYVKEEGLINLFSQIRYTSKRRNIVKVINFIADCRPEYEHLRRNQPLSTKDETFTEFYFQTELISRLSKLTELNIRSFYHLPSGKVADIVLINAVTNEPIREIL